MISDILKSIGILVAASCIGLGFYHLGFTEVNIITVYILGVLITSVVTKKQIYSLISSFASVMVFNFLFTEPRHTLWAYDSEYIVTFGVMFLAAFITGTLALQNEKNAREKEAASMLAEKEQLRADLLRAISHDLRTPLTSISGNASNLLSHGESFETEVKKQLYKDIYDDSMWLISLVENILFVTRIEEGRMNLNVSAELLEDVIAEALRHVSRMGAEHKITVKNDAELCVVKIDARLIVQVIINIVENAIKYTPKGSEICIAVCKYEDVAEVKIADDGQGISDEMKPHIFDMFYSGANKKSESRRGLGLGLSLCKSIIMAHGGTIEVSDNEPHGAVFTFTLPAEEVNLHE